MLMKKNRMPMKINPLLRKLKSPQQENLICTFKSYKKSCGYELKKVELEGGWERKSGRFVGV
jgi:hypothetical protein